MMKSRSVHKVKRTSASTIIATYLDCFRDDRSGRFPVASIVVFYGVPLATGILVYFLAEPNTAMNWTYQALSVFAILLGLLISVQMSVFSIYNRFRTAAWEEFHIEEKAEVNFALKGLHKIISLLSYLHLVVVAGMVACLLMAIINPPTILQEAVAVGFYAHIILNALLLFRLGRTLFQRVLDERP